MTTTFGTSDASAGSDDPFAFSSTPVIPIKQTKPKISKGTKLQEKEPPKKIAAGRTGRPENAGLASSVTKAKAAAANTATTKTTKSKTPRTTQALNNKSKSSNSNDKKAIDVQTKKTTPKKVAVSSTIQANKKTSNPREEHKVKKTEDVLNHCSESDGEDQAACCMCHCGLDCSDRALFFPKDRKLELEEDEDYYFGLDDPYLDSEKLYDRNNALVYCDTCNRLYHQKCHFVPILVIPRGEFHCLICTIQQQQQKQQLKKPSKKRERKGSIKSSSASASTLVSKSSISISSQPSGIADKFLKRDITDQLFQSPPNKSSETVDIQSLEKEFELVSGAAKALVWDRQFKQLKTFLKSQASNIRMAKTTLATMTSTKRNRQHFLESSTKTTKSSQELAQTFCKLTGAKFKIREALLSLEAFRTNNETIDFSSLYSWCKENTQHASHVFPYGSTVCKDRRRVVPRTRERKDEKADEARCRIAKKCYKKANGVIPNEIIVNGSKTSKPRGRSNSNTSEAVVKSSKTQTCAKRGDKKNTRKTTQKEDRENDGSGNDDADDNDNDNDNDSGITLDDLQCSICMIGDATDCNDVILCDGKDCHRAYHMKCVHPAVKPEDIENEDEHWFCPICSKSAELMNEMHILCVADDGDDDDASSSSWEDVHDVFPGSQWEFETATKYLKGKRNEDTQRLLAMFLGEDINKKEIQMPIGSDSEDENDYSLFDEDSFQERKRQEREEESIQDDSVCSSQATLQEMDGVDLKVGKAELAALSDQEKSESEDSDDESETKIRRSRRLGKKDGFEESKMTDNGADFDEANIIVGKRKRTRVNYRKLNDMMFGDLTDHQQGLIDGGDDFDATKIKPTKSEVDNQSDNNESDNASENDEQDSTSDN
eukprot:CAMPEP_0168175316 /NCGR_PEP_ID=MMETSP0139_2-20121125/7046_1 /TAXON_ID=44445 /ORGANISM="Pseudo-nitzschia australis, Strain 10249 10 AB" /LENGTH=884 /DNA_ID=CAMNT_0008093673 /DNA_START=126 /DNA_END=2780 /DNA_ORIENTATION=+